MDDDLSPVLSIYTRLKLNHPVAMGDERLGELYGGVLGLPETFLINAHGKVRAYYQGETDLKRLEIEIQSLLPTELARHSFSFNCY